MKLPEFLFNKEVYIYMGVPSSLFLIGKLEMDHEDDLPYLVTNVSKRLYFNPDKIITIKELKETDLKSEGCYV